MNAFTFDDTGLCEPSDSKFQAWLQRMALLERSGCIVELQGRVAEKDSLALVSLYKNTNGPNWTRSSAWLNGAIETWEGVEIEDYWVTSLRLQGRGLAGEIPNTIGDLTALEELLLSDNQLTGEIPPSFGNLVRLIQLRLDNTSLSGTLPLSLANLSQLELFYVNNTQLCVPLDPSFQAWTRGIFVFQWDVCTSVSVETIADNIGKFSLLQNYPNPFNPRTTISYRLAKTGWVELVVYDLLGERVAVLENNMRTAGDYEITFDASILSPGNYFYTLRVGDYTVTKAMVLAR